ncbi:methylated-DNA--[protein]-cysteine S-methyltransferase [Candidatus Poriferisocius sp.]|uniref:methylated-DNA--[protein]-cysteine S-methyltransferase n=1 Tax=Candidatus Poriferisocius sp. TaxID=3101276 RepID=UPI003B027FB4
MSPAALLTRPQSAAALFTVASGVLDTPIGTLNLMATSRGLVRVGFGSREGHPDPMAGDPMAELVESSEPSWAGGGDPAWLDEPIGQLREYFDGSRRQFHLALDRRSTPGFYRRVLDSLMTVGYGTTVSYGELARMAGSPGAARAVGTAMATNPIPVVVPCHRVVRSDGSVGQYGGSPDAKSWLLSHERSRHG